MSCRSLQLCAGLEADIEGATHPVAQRRQERNVQDPEGGEDEALEEEITAAAGGAENEGGEGAVGGIGEVPWPPGGRRTG